MRREQGFSLIEILVTMLVMSVGLLGIAGIILTNLKNNQSSQARGQATVLINDIVDRMRANRVTAEGAAASPYELTLGELPAAGTSIASQDRAAWALAVSTAVPKGEGRIEYDAPSRNFTITVKWDDTRVKGDGTTFGLADQKIIVETHL